MRKNRKKSHQHAKLPAELEKRLSVYALTAAAAGVGLAGALAMPTPAFADILTFTPSPPFQVNASTNFPVFSSRGVPLLGFEEAACNPSICDGYSFQYLLAGWVYPFNPNVMLSQGSSQGGNILKLPSGAVIGSSGNFQSYGVVFSKTRSGIQYGNWSTAAPGFVGLRFLNSVSGSVNAYFGWAKLNVSASSNGGIVAQVDQAAIELCPDAPIHAGSTGSGASCAEPGQLPFNSPYNTPEPSTLALLAMGAVGLFALRRKKLAGSN